MDLKELKQQAKFQKKDILFSEVLGVCKVDELTRLSTQTGEMILYYGLRSIADPTKVSYIPVENHSVLLRELVSVEEAKQVLAKATETGQIASAEVGFAENFDGAGAEVAGESAGAPERIDPLLIQEAQYVLKHFE